MRKQALGVVLFAAAAAVLIAVLKVLNWAPGILQEGLPGTYNSIDEVKSRLAIRDIYTPAYYPQGLRWPPARITAQTKPHIMVLQEFARLDDGAIALIIVQTARHQSAPTLRIEMTRTTEQVRYPLKGRNALLEAGLCGESTPCCSISWDEIPYHIRVIMLSAPSEIVKIADSMLSGQ